MDHAIVVVSEKSSPYPKSSRLSPMLSSRRFVVLHFTFMFVIHFKLIFVKGLRSVSSFVLLFFFACGHPVVLLAASLKRPSLLHCIPFAPSSSIS